MNVRRKRGRELKHKLSRIGHEWKTKTIKNIMYGGKGLRDIMSQEFVYSFLNENENENMNYHELVMNGRRERQRERQHKLS